MEPLEITHMEMDDNPDLGELYMLINTNEPTAAVSYLVDDDRNFYFRVDPETDHVVGAMALFANDWFEEIAEAFRRHDLNHPDVRFFLQQKVTALAERLDIEPHTSGEFARRDSTEPVSRTTAKPTEIT